jgi:hypothetical protein
MTPRLFSEPRARRSIQILAIISADLVSCTLALERQSGQCRTHADCQALSPRYVCASSQVCVELTSDTPALDSGGSRECRDHVDCARTDGVSFCREGRCQPLNNPEAGCISPGWGTTAPLDGAEVLGIGMLISNEELRSESLLPRVTGAVATAISDFNRVRTDARGVGLPALVGVACDESNPAALDYLVDTLQVRIVMGPTDPGLVEQILTRKRDGVLLMPPFADGPDLLPEVNDGPGVVVSCRPNRSGVQSYLLNAVAEARRWIESLGAPGLGTTTPALAVSGDAATTSFANRFDDGTLAAAGIRRVLYAAQPGGLGMVNALRDAEPRVNMVVAASSEDEWQDNIAAYDSVSFEQQGNYPYYLLADKRPEVYRSVLSDQLTADGFPRQYLRILGLDYQRGEQSLLARDEFASDHYLVTQSQPEPGLEYTYDCTYVAVYAAIAASLRLELALDDLPPEALMLGLGALQGGGPALPVGALSIPEVVEVLTANEGLDGSIDLIGTSGDLDFAMDSVVSAAPSLARRYVSVGPPSGEFYCIDAVSKTFCDTGVVFPASGGPPSRGSGLCACLRAP